MGATRHPACLKLVVALLLPALGPAAAAQEVLFEIADLSGNLGVVMPIPTILGDLDGDGRSELLVGDPYSTPDCPAKTEPKGSVTVYAADDGAPLLVIIGRRCNDELGQAVVAAGDWNGDGVPDFATMKNFKVLVCSGHGGHALHDFPAAFSTTLAPLGDVDGDGRNELAIGQPGASSGVGSVTVYRGGSGDVLHVFEGAHPGDGFGISIANAGDADLDGVDDLLIGTSVDAKDMPGYAQLRSVRTGALIHEWLGGLQPNPAAPATGFGRKVAAATDVNADGWPDVLIALDHDESAGVLGKVRVYSGRDGTWLLGVSDIGPTASFVSLAGVGDVNFDGHGDFAIGHSYSYPDPGRVGLYSGHDGSVMWDLQGEGSELDYFVNVAAAGDWNGDAIPDLLVGTSARVLVVSGGPFTDQPTLQWNGSSGGTAFASVVARAGDLDADGLEDLLVGLPLTDDGGPDAGAVRAFAGRDGSLLWEADSSVAGAAFGKSVSRAGDLDGDHIEDVLVGAPLDGSVAAEAGSAALLSGADGSLLRAWPGLAAGDQFGTAVAGLGDVNGDGVPDIAIGAPMHDAAGSNAGAAFVHSGFDGALLYRVDGPTIDARAGAALAAPGDMDGDGWSDLAVGAPRAKFADVALGQVLLVSGPTGQTLLTLTGTDAGGRFGGQLAGAGDVDADGRADVVVGAPQEQVSLIFPILGAVSVFSGGDGHEFFKLQGEPDTLLGFGAAVDGPGDFDGDGQPDVVVGAFSQSVGYGARVLRGLDGELLASYAPQPQWPGFGGAVALADLNGDGRSEAVIAAEGSADPAGFPGFVGAYSQPAWWTALPGGVAGSAGIPQLTGSGSFLASVPVSITLSSALPLAPARFVLGFDAALTPFAGGVMVPAPLVTVQTFVGADGSASLAGVWPALSIGPATLLVQAWVVDPAAVQGVAGSNALLGTIP